MFYPGITPNDVDAMVRERDQTNPKDLIGATKVDLSAMPPVAIAHGAHSLMDGASKYGPYNWRANKVQARIYVAAAMRHISAWLDGEEVAEDSGVHHLGHVIGCMAILLDAQESGNLVDDRPQAGPAAKVMARLNAAVKSRKEASRASQNPGQGMDARIQATA